MPRRPRRTFEKLAQTLHVELKQVSSAVSLFDEGNSVPFVARYRQEFTGCLSDTQLRQLHRQLGALDRLEAKRDAVLEELQKTNHLTQSIRMEIDCAESVEVLEEIREPFKKRKVSKATAAREAGMEPLAEKILQDGFQLKHMKSLSRGLPWKEAFAHAQCIIAEDLSRLPQIKAVAEETVVKRGSVSIGVTEMAERIKGEYAGGRRPEVRKVDKGLELSENANNPWTYEQYFNAKLTVKDMKPHQILAVNRAENLGFLNLKLEWPTEAVFTACMQELQKQAPHLTSTSMDQIVPAVTRAVSTLLQRSTERKLRKALTERAVVDAMATFSRNLWSLLLMPPLVGVTVMGVDPGFTSGCKLCVCNPQGVVLSTDTIFPHRSTTYRTACAETAFVSLISRFKVQAIALGDGQGSKEMESFMYRTLNAAGLTVGWTIVSEDGASVYSASELASEELPELDVSMRGAVSIARRLQDPLGELVKIDPCHLGIGLYQHDMKRSAMEENLRGVVESAVNTVGVDVNTASPSLLSYVAGLSPSFADKIAKHRAQNGDFANREQLLGVHGIGPKTFQQCAGFLRIRDGDNALDNTGVHPESYHVVHQLLEIFIPDRMIEDNVSTEDLTLLQEVLLQMRHRGEQMDFEELAQRVSVGVPTLKNIVEDLIAPGRDIRGQSTTASLKWTENTAMESLRVGDRCWGTVKNVVQFGAFVDINAEVTGLVHVSQMKQDTRSLHWVDPHEICKVGDKLNVEVTAIDIEKRRVSLRILDHEL